MKSTAAVALLLLNLVFVQCAESSVTPENATTQVRAAARGDTYRGTITLHNSEDVPTDVKLYQTDYVFSADGRSNFGSPGRLPRSNARWLKLHQEQITLAPGEHANVDYEVRVPDDAQLSGTYWSAVMVEQIAASEASGRRAQVELHQSVRHAVQIITEIGGSGSSQIAFSNASLLHSQGAQALCVDLENKGERWLQTDVWLELHDLEGRAIGKFSGRRMRTFPGTSVRNCIDLGVTKPGTYLALLVADGGRNDLFGTQFEIVVP